MHTLRHIFTITIVHTRTHLHSPSHILAHTHTHTHTHTLPHSYYLFLHLTFRHTILVLVPLSFCLSHTSFFIPILFFPLFFFLSLLYLFCFSLRHGHTLCKTYSRTYSHSHKHTHILILSLSHLTFLANFFCPPSLSFSLSLFLTNCPGPNKKWTIADVWGKKIMSFRN